MTEVTPISSRKADHLRINIEENVQSGLKNGLENYRFLHRALPELNLEEIDLGMTFLGKSLNAPLLISSMTGGVEKSKHINLILAEAAELTGIAMGVGSQRAAIDYPELASTFKVRSVAPNILLFANIGAIQLNYGYGIEECQRAIDMIQADALILHLNALQEAVQVNGNTNFAGLIDKIEQVCKVLPVPVIAKEVGWGFSTEDIAMLVNAGIAAIDVAGAGGTSWSQVEMFRASNESQAKLASLFSNWGITTADSILNARRIAPSLPIIASGGLRNGLEITKCIALGASICGMAYPFLNAAMQSLEETVRTIQDIQREVQVTMFVCGVGNLTALHHTMLQHI